MARARFDRGTQRDLIVEGAWNVIMRDGLARASMRAIAQEVGCTTGVLTHHFRDKRDILAVALDKIAKEIAARMRAATESKTGADGAGALAQGFLPMDEEGRRLWIVWMQFLAEALSDQEILDQHSRQYDWTRKRLAAYFEAMLPAESVSKKALRIEADYFIALLDGLGVNGVASGRRYSRKLMETIVQQHLSRVLLAHQP